MSSVLRYAVLNGRDQAVSEQSPLPVTLVSSSESPFYVIQSDADTNGDLVPTWKAQTFTYDGSNNLETATVMDGTDTWVRTYVYTGGNMTSDSGWVKQ